MTDSNKKPDEQKDHRLSEAYHRMLERTRARIEEIEHDTGPMLHNAIENARETATELGELTREEAQKIAEYLRRDLESAGQFLEQSGKELGDWLNFDVQVVEQSLLDLFWKAADRTRVELAEWQVRADVMGEWHTGEITGLGTLECKSCGERLHFHKTGHIPPCPKCHGTRWRRISGE